MKVTTYREGVKLTVGQLPSIWIHAGVFVVPLFLTFPLWNGFRANGMIAAALVIVGMILSVLAHELGHALTAWRLGYRPTLIRLHAGGGEAVWEDDGCTAREYDLITIAGPAANLLLGIFLLAAYYLFLPDPAASYVPSAETPWSRPPPTLEPPLFRAVFWLGWINLALCAVNMLPGFPLDGGHLFYSAVARRRGPNAALLWTGLLGTIFAIIAKMVFFAGILAGFVIWFPPYLRPNWRAFRRARQQGMRLFR